MKKMSVHHHITGSKKIRARYLLMLAMFPVPKKAVIRRNIFINVKDQPQTRLMQTIVARRIIQCE